VRFGRVASKADLSSASGNITLAEAAGPIDAKTMSGDVTVERAAGDSVKASSMSGDVFLGGLSQGAVDANTMSGDVVMDVVPGVRVWMDLSTMSGRAESELDQGDETKGDAQLQLRASTKSGDVRVRRSTRTAAV
jgi:DUF4097 and DUF4098 domain-containing protein YvlB